MWTILVNESLCILIKHLQKFVPRGLVDNKPALRQLMPWGRTRYRLIIWMRLHNAVTKGVENNCFQSMEILEIKTLYHISFEAAIYHPLLTLWICAHSLCFLVTSWMSIRASVLFSGSGSCFLCFNELKCFVYVGNIGNKSLLPPLLPTTLHNTLSPAISQRKPYCSPGQQTTFSLQSLANWLLRNVLFWNVILWYNL